MATDDGMWEDVVVDGQTRRLRQGYTTGASAAAATKGALQALVTQSALAKAEITLPIGRQATFSLQNLMFDGGQASCGVIKDGGDDPDATHGAMICATVSWSTTPGIQLDGGEGVGRITRPGLSRPVGEAAINRVPSRMIHQAVEEVLGFRLKELGVKVVVSVPGGEEIARHTWNGRLGIVGGISILGTTGIVHPYSLSSWRASVVQAVNVAAANGQAHIVLTTGGRSEEFAKRLYPRLSPLALIDVGGFLGNALGVIARRPQVRRVSVVGMMGKMSKVAGGQVVLHAHQSSVDLEFLSRLAETAHASEKVAEQVRGANTANQVREIMEEAGLWPAFFAVMARAIVKTVRVRVGRPLAVEVALLGPDDANLGHLQSDQDTPDGYTESQEP